MRGHTSRRVSTLAILGSGPECCFVDEVVIDFPSISHAVDRMRRSFVADEGATPLSAALCLSRLEARHGAVLPLDLPVRCTCTECGGRGETWGGCCVRCGGSGAESRQRQLRVAVPAGVSDGACFRFSVTPRHDPTTRVELRIHVACD
jgi:hypothetical protein